MQKEDMTLGEMMVFVMIVCMVITSVLFLQEIGVFYMKNYEKAKPICPHCGGNMLLKWVRDEKRQEYTLYECVMCNREYTPKIIGGIQHEKEIN